MPEVPPDHARYDMFPFAPDTYYLVVEGLEYYKRLLVGEPSAFKDHPDLERFLEFAPDEQGEREEELRQVELFKSWFQREAGAPRPDRDALIFGLSQRSLRFLKSVALLYLEHLREQRNELAGDPKTRASIGSLDAKLARAAERLNMRTLGVTVPLPLAAAPEIGIPPSERPADLPGTPAPRPTVLATIEIRDPALRRNCLDLFQQFQESGEHDRLGMILANATTHMEVRLRELCGAPKHLAGEELSAFAFMKPPRRLTVSDVESQQVAVHRMFCGAFGFVRNKSHHESLGDQDPVRVLQQLALVDYLIFLAESATQSPECAKPAASSEPPTP